MSHMFHGMIGHMQWRLPRSGAVFLLSMITGILVAPLSVSAAALTLDPEEATLGPGDSILVTVRLDPDLEGECINAVTGVVSFPPGTIDAVAFSKGESLLTLWVEEPIIDREKGLVRFSGGIPGGYCGRVLGDPGLTNIIGKIVFAVPGFTVGAPAPKQTADIVFASGTEVLLNDGAGTPALLTFKNASFVRAETAQRTQNDWLDAVRADTTPPDPFTVEIHRDADVLEGKYFAVFSTIDKQSGIHHFEVLEESPKRYSLFGSNPQDAYVPVTSPYVLKDQARGGKLFVRAVDQAGNKREAVVLPDASASIDIDALPKEPESGASSEIPVWMFLAGGAIVLLVLLAIGALIVMRMRRT